LRSGESVRGAAEVRIAVLGLRGFPNVQGGIETHCENLYPRLAALGYNVRVYGRRHYLKTKKTFEFCKVEIVPLPSVHIKSLETLSYMAFCWLACLFSRPDIAHIHGIGPALVTPFFRLLGLKVVLTIHSHNYDHDKWGKIAKFIFKLGERIGCHFANEVIAISGVINNNIKKLYNREDTHLIYNGVDISDKKCDGSGGFILAIGRFTKEKGFHDLVDAVCDFGQKLVIAGKPDHESDYSRALEKSARAAGVELAGFVQGEAKENLFLKCRLFVIPSLHEGLPFTLLEAMSYNCDILASDIPANMEVSLPEECYYPVGDVGTLGMKIKEKFKRPFEPCDYDAILKERYDWGGIVEKVGSVYGGVV
jgi:glycosyltransferase involved in cell wall biosynthesis